MVHYYSNAAGEHAGLTNAVCAGYAVPDVRFVSAFDVNASKVDSDLSEAIWATPNNALKFAEVPHLEGEAFGGTPLELELRICVEDSPSAAGNVLDAVRYVKFAMDRGIAGVIGPVSSLLMKATPRLMSETAALAELKGMMDH